MTLEEDIKNWKIISDFFFRQEIEVELSYLRKEISRFKRNKLISTIRKDWDYNMELSNPFIKNNTKLKEIFDNINKGS